jgi:hypothetical protein
MKPFSLLLLLFALFSCHPTQKQKVYGEAFDTALAVSVQEMMVRMANAPKEEVVVKGTISTSCQGEGCWLTIKNDSGDEVYVDWDEKFHLPHDLSGKNVMVKGAAYHDSTSTGYPVAIKASGVQF